VLRSTPPIIQESTSPVINPYQFIKRETEYDPNDAEVPIEFYTSEFVFDFEPGSQDSIDLLESLIECENL